MSDKKHVCRCELHKIHYFKMKHKMTLLMAVFNITLLNVKALKTKEDAGKSCRSGFFIDTEGNCHRQLSCNEIEKELKFISLMEGGYVKNMTRVKWNNIDLVHSKPKYHDFKEDFKSGLVLLEMLQESQFVLDLVGMCYKPMQVDIMEQFFKQGSFKSGCIMFLF